MWKSGTIELFGEEFRYDMKVFEIGSEFGINGGKISKLFIKRKGETVCCYDRGWEVYPIDEISQQIFEILIKAEN